MLVFVNAGPPPQPRWQNSMPPGVPPKLSSPVGASPPGRHMRVIWRSHKTSKVCDLRHKGMRIFDRIIAVAHRQRVTLTRISD